MNVHELNRDQLDELKAAYFWGDDYDPTTTNAEGLPVLFPGDIPDRVIYRVFAGIDFVPDDFAPPAPFLDDHEKMIDFIILSKERFLESYSYLTEAEYNATASALLSLLFD